MDIKGYWIGMKYNKKNKDGSINSYQDTAQPGDGYSVPFSDKYFFDQIEDDILPAVENLNYKGYPTITSCHGHGIYNYLFNGGILINEGPSITIVVDKNTAKDIENHFSNFFLKVIVNDTIKREDNVVNLRITSRVFISNFVSNKFLCDKINQLVKKL